MQSKLNLYNQVKDENALDRSLRLCRTRSDLLWRTVLLRKSIFDKTTALTADAKVFSNDFLQTSLKNGKSDPSKVVKASAGAIDLEIRTEEKALGKFVSIGPLTPTFRNYSRNDSESTFSVNLHTNAVFEKGNADLELTVDRTNGNWLAKSISFIAPASGSTTIGK